MLATTLASAARPTTLPSNTVTGYRVIITADSESDHSPVVAEFDLTRAVAQAGTGE
jgi:hypothetical protein